MSNHLYSVEYRVKDLNTGLYWDNRQCLRFPAPWSDYNVPESVQCYSTDGAVFIETGDILRRLVLLIRKPLEDSGYRSPERPPLHNPIPESWAIEVSTKGEKIINPLGTATDYLTAFSHIMEQNDQLRWVMYMILREGDFKEFRYIGAWHPDTAEYIRNPDIFEEAQDLMKHIGVPETHFKMRGIGIALKGENNAMLSKMAFPYLKLYDVEELRQRVVKR